MKIACAVALVALLGACAAIDIESTEVSRQFAPFDLAGYRITRDVVELGDIDLDIRDLRESLFILVDFVGGERLYRRGLNSLRPNGRPISLRYLARSASRRLRNEDLFELYAAYYGSRTYADDIMLDALRGQGDYVMRTDVQLYQVAIKTAQYTVVLMEAIHSFEESVEKCRRGRKRQAERFWDAGWAYYTGNQEGPDGSGSGFLAYGLADKRCPQFDTCVSGSTTAQANADLLAVVTAGKALISAGDCRGARRKIREIIPLASIGVIQGSLRYAYLADPTITPVLTVQQAEGVAFLLAYLPQVDQCDPAVAAYLADEMLYDGSDPTKVPIQGGYAAWAAQLQSVYPCLGVTCAQIGGYINDGVVVIPACTDP